MRMRKNVLRTFIALCGCFAVGLCANADVKAETAEYYRPAITEDESYTPGVTVAEDEDSPTGYTVIFVYQDAEASSVSLYSKEMYFYKEETGLEVRYTPYAWEDGMFYMGADSRTLEAPYVEYMEKVGDDLWVLKLPLPSGLFHYQYCVGGEYIADPANEPVKNELTGTQASNSVVYVPCNEEKQSTDHSAVVPREDQQGELVYDQYMDGDTARDVIIYLPYGYDEDREEPYKVIYASHGAGGSELNWIEAGLNNIMDNLIAEGLTEPAVVVCMNQTGIEDPVLNQKENLRPYVEANYNVATDAENVAYCGLSNGGSITAKILVDDPTAYGYYGVWSSAQSASLELDGIEGLDVPVVMIGIAMDDSRYDEACIFYENMAAISEKVTFFEEHGGHDFIFWTDAYTEFVKNIVWK